MNNNVVNLRNIYDDISRWLVYAEAKHIAIISVACFFGAQLVDNEQIFFNKFPVFGGIILFMVCVSLLMSIISFIPFLNNSQHMIKFADFMYKNVDENSNNILFYLTVFKMDRAGQYCDKLKAQLGVSEFSNLEKNYITQICEVSKVATIKYAIFKAEIGFVVLTGILWAITCVLVA